MVNIALFISSVFLQVLPPWISFYINQGCKSVGIDNVVDITKIRKFPNCISSTYNFISLRDFRRLECIFVPIGLGN